MSEALSARKRRLLVAFFWLAPLGLLPYFFHPKPANVSHRDSVCMDPFCTTEMAAIPAGEQLVGAQATDPTARGYDPDAAEDEAPARLVAASAFFLDVHLVTVTEYRDCVEHCGCEDQAVATGGYMNYGAVGREHHPMNGVSYDEATAYCSWIGARLPSEEEWERAARGPEGWRFPWGDELPQCNDRGDGSMHEACPYSGTRPVGTQTAGSPFGVRGLGGGLWQWTSTPYAQDGSSRVQKGGGWSSDDMLDRRAAFRGGLPPQTRLADVSFRCARSADAPLGAAAHHESASSKCQSPRQ